MKSLPEPYAQWDCGVLYCADCLDVLPLLEAGSVDAVVTDPPYLDMKGGTVVKTCFGGGVAPRNCDSVTVGNELGNADALWDCSRLASKGAIVFCSYHWVDKCVEMIGGNRRALLTWFKRNSMPSVQNSPHFLTEYAWATQYGIGINWRYLRTHFDEPMLQAGCMADERICIDGRAVHPAQKPLALMESILLPGMETVLDPYCGTGTTAVACIRTGRRFIGIELEPRYCKIAADRINRELQQPRLPFFAPLKEKQAEMFE